ncbi:MAG: hypothetical protein D8M58_01655 [Calditrichaeota bacterium]|nr:MAG: hypothetical protein DWQ03_05425 [Calditrichota bacterium]MBL1204073.1 hypothetical protein [Calditrichota bacterium]NOG43904.1 hypothetical protein [Calditrichota bacterium]
MKFIFSLFVTVSIVFAQNNYFPNGTYLQDIPTPESVLGFNIGEQPARYHEALGYIKVLAEKSPRVQFFVQGETHEGRTLSYLVISSEENIKNLDKIKSNINKLSDPRSLSNPKQIVESSPAVAWMMYSIHGNEISGTDASLQLAYQLAAGTDEKTMNILNNLIVGIDPMENPDGRERYLHQVQQMSGKVINSDGQKIQNSGLWPSGRVNHYLFDLNRDWFILSQPESQARVKTQLEWHPQLVVDAHEMGSQSTFLFNPPREPINNNIPESVRKWWDIFADDQRNAFDENNFSYYSGEWYDDLYVGYGSAAPNYQGAIAILYEQAHTDGTVIKRHDGTNLTYHKAVKQQFTSSVSNLATAANNKNDLLNHYFSFRKKASNLNGAYYIKPSENVGRVSKLIEKLQLQGIEVSVSKTSFSSEVKDYSGKTKSQKFPKGTIVIPLNQPLGTYIHSIFEFDPRIKKEVLAKEQEKIEKQGYGIMYDVTGWSMLMAYGVDAYFSNTSESIKTEPYQGKKNTGKLTSTNNAVAYICEFSDDNSIKALQMMFDAKLKVRSAIEPFSIEGKNYDRGTLLLRVNENPSDIKTQLENIVTATGLNIIGLSTSHSQKGNDLGGGYFALLEEPKIALLTGTKINIYSKGTIWNLLDNEYGQRITILNYEWLGSTDLRKYNVLLLPSSWWGYSDILPKHVLTKLKTWVKGGGTLISIGSASAFLADSSSGFSQAKLKRQSLKKLSEYAEALEDESLWQTKIDEKAIWDGIIPKKKDAKKEEKADFKTIKKQDKRARLYYPKGAILKVNLNEEHWLNFGLGSSVSALVQSRNAFLSKKPVKTAGRFSDAADLRQSGLLWPQARERWANTAYLTQESMGNGQIIMFANEPIYRSYFYGTARLLLNAIYLGPGMGADAVNEW